MLTCYLICCTALEEGTEDDGSPEPHIGQHGLWAELQRHLLPEEAQPTGESCRPSPGRCGAVWSGLMWSPAERAPAKTTFIGTDRKAVGGEYSA